MRNLLLFGTFFRIGLFSIGGGLATLPFLFEIADNTRGINQDGWLSRVLIGNMLAVAQSLPGAIGANISAYTGFYFSGIGGAYIAALGLIAPSICIIIMVARALAAFKESTLVQNLFAGFRPAAAGLLSAAGFGAIALSLWNAAAPAWYAYIRWKEALIFLALAFLIIRYKKHPIVYIMAAAGAGLVFKL